MKQLKVVIFALAISFNTAQVAAQEYNAELITLIAQLANLAVMADHCEQQLNYLGSSALKNTKCTSFTNSYFELWPNRNALQDEILFYTVRAEQGKMPCNEICQNMLLRSEELRIMVTYTLDYMDFAKVM